MKIGWWLAGLALALVAAVIQFPAAWLSPQVDRITQKHWRLAGVEGSLWRGSGTLFVEDRSSGTWLPAWALTWQVQWPALLKGRIATQVKFDDGGRANVSAGISGWTLDDFDFSMPAIQLATLLPGALAQYGWYGSLTAKGSGFGCDWNGSSCAGQANISWRGAGTTQLLGQPLGDYRLRLIGEGGALRWDMGTERGRLQVTGVGEISANTVQFNGEAFASGEDSARLETMLRAIGRPSSTPGHYLIEYREARAARF